MATDTVEKEVIEAEIVRQPSGPRAVSVSPKQLRTQMTRDQDIRKVIEEYIKNNMVEGKDYGSIVVNGHASKPSLLKPGAEKFCGLFKIRPTFKKDTETVEMLGDTPGIIAYICELVDSRGEVIGEGRGSVKVDPNGKDFDINKGVKIAEKRAQIDAVLRAGSLSDFFTQDMEDAPKGETSTTDKKPRRATTKQIQFLANKVKWGANIHDKDEIIRWLDSVIGKPLDELLMNDIDSAIEKIDKALREDKVHSNVAEVAPEEKDVVITEIPDGPVNLDNLPY